MKLIWVVLIIPCIYGVAFAEEDQLAHGFGQAKTCLKNFAGTHEIEKTVVISSGDRLFILTDNKVYVPRIDLNGPTNSPKRIVKIPEWKKAYSFQQKDGKLEILPVEETTGAERLPVIYPFGYGESLSKYWIKEYLRRGLKSTSEQLEMQSFLRKGDVRVSSEGAAKDILADYDAEYTEFKSALASGTITPKEFREQTEALGKRSLQVQRQLIHHKGIAEAGITNPVDLENDYKEQLTKLITDCKNFGKGRYRGDPDQIEVIKGYVNGAVNGHAASSTQDFERRLEDTKTGR